MPSTCQTAWTGLGGGVVMVALTGMAIVAGVAGRTAELRMILLLIAVVTGFLYLNLQFPWRSRAKVFMGDAGSMFLGLMLAFLLVSLSQGENRAMAPVTALWLLAIPLIDTVSMMLRRSISGRSPFAADREHFHHILVDAGFTVSRTLLVIIGFATALTGIGLLGLYLDVPERVQFYAFLGLFGLHFAVLMRTWRARRFLNRRLDRRGSVDRRSREDRRSPVTDRWAGKVRRIRRERRTLAERRRLASDD